MMAAKLIYLTDEEYDILSKYLQMGGKDCDSTNLESKIVFMRDKFREPEDKSTKHLMTRVEAINCFTNHMATPSSTSAERIIDFYIAAGMLEVKEERKTTICFMGKDDKYVEIWKENKLIKTVDLS